VCLTQGPPHCQPRPRAHCMAAHGLAPGASAVLGPARPLSVSQACCRAQPLQSSACSAFHAARGSCSRLDSFRAVVCGISQPKPMVRANPTRQWLHGHSVLCTFAALRKQGVVSCMHSCSLFGAAHHLRLVQAPCACLLLDVHTPSSLCAPEAQPAWQRGPSCAGNACLPASAPVRLRAHSNHQRALACCGAVAVVGWRARAGFLLSGGPACVQGCMLHAAAGLQ
jgi:hypothetical protein